MVPFGFSLLLQVTTPNNLVFLYKLCHPLTECNQEIAIEANPTKKLKNLQHGFFVHLLVDFYQTDLVF